MGVLVKNLFCSTVYCFQKRSPRVAENSDKILPDNVFVVLHRCKSFVDLRIELRLFLFLLFLLYRSQCIVDQLDLLVCQTDAKRLLLLRVVIMIIWHYVGVVLI